MRWSLVLLAVLIAGAVGVVVFRRPAAPPPPPAATIAELASTEDAGLSDDEVFARSMALLAEARHRAEEEDAARRSDPSTPLTQVRPDAGGALAILKSANDGGITPSVRAELETLARMLQDEQYPGAVERVHALFRDRSPAAIPGLELVAATAIQQARAAGTRQIEPILPRLQELPTSDGRVRAPLAKLFATVALASAREGQPERSRQQARAALALEERTPDAYLALGEYQFQDNDLTGALDTWERGLRLDPGNVQLTRRLERGRSEAQRLGGLERVASEHFVVSFDGRSDVPGARATLEIMEAAYRSVGALFQLHPDGPIALVLYPEHSYELEGHAPWSAGVYTGKIRLPSAGADASSLRFRGTLFHEYAHALFQRATSGKGGPAWLNEGFAELAKLEADPRPALRCGPDVHLFPLKGLEGGFGRIGNHKQAHLAYLEARHAVEEIVGRHGPEGVRAVLAEVSRGAPFPVAFEKALGIEYDAFTRSFDAEAHR